MADKPAKVTSADIRAALLLRYPTASHALMFEVAPNTGGGTRYADAVAFSLWASHGHKIEGIEIKVSRSDFLNEMKQPEKSQPVFQYCDHWWLACPKDLVDPKELPSTWGLLELREDGALHQRVKAPRLEDKIPPTLGFIASLVRRGTSDMRKEVDKLVQRELRMRTDQIERSAKLRAEQSMSNRHSHAMETLATVEKLEAELGVKLIEWGRMGKDWWMAAALMRELGGKYSALCSLRESASRLVKAIDDSGIRGDDG